MVEMLCKMIPFKPGEPIIVAIGRKPEKGRCGVTYIEIPNRKPVIREDGSADYL